MFIAKMGCKTQRTKKRKKKKNQHKTNNPPRKMDTILQRKKS